MLWVNFMTDRAETGYVGFSIETHSSKTRFDILMSKPFNDVRQAPIPGNDTIAFLAGLDPFSNVSFDKGIEENEFKPLMGNNAKAIVIDSKVGFSGDTANLTAQDWSRAQRTQDRRDLHVLLNYVTDAVGNMEIDQIAKAVLLAKILSWFEIDKNGFVLLWDQNPAAQRPNVLFSPKLAEYLHFSVDNPPSLAKLMPPESIKQYEHLLQICATMRQQPGSKPEGYELVTSVIIMDQLTSMRLQWQPIIVDGKLQGFYVGVDTKEQLLKDSNTDALTGLVNRKALNEELEQIDTDPDVNEVVIILIDVDKFKSINDTYGHSVGDQVLKAIGTRLNSNFRKNGPVKVTVGRFGGDEFEIRIKGNAHSVIESILERVLESLHTFEFTVRDHPNGNNVIKVSLSHGIGQITRDQNGHFLAGGLEKTKKEADTRLYEQKESKKTKAPQSASSPPAAP